MGCQLIAFPRACSSDASANLCVPAGYKKPIEGYNLLRSLERICGSFNGVPKELRVTLIALWSALAFSISPMTSAVSPPID